jgi:hypothetical protein
MAIVPTLCVPILLLCCHFVDGHNVDDLEKSKWNAMMKVLDELQNVVQIQNDQISFLETRYKMTDKVELHDLRETVHNQKQTYFFVGEEIPRPKIYGNHPSQGT